MLKFVPIALFFTAIVSSAECKIIHRTHMCVCVCVCVCVYIYVYVYIYIYIYISS